MPSSHVESLAAIESGYWWYVGRIELAIELAEAWRRKRGLSRISGYVDIGCGTGGFAHALQQHFAFERWDLLDGDPAVLEWAKKLPGAQARCVDLSKPFDLPAGVQLVSCMDVIEHLPDDRDFLKRLHAQLDPGAAAVLSVPAHQFLFSEWDRQLGHYRRYSRGQLRERLVEAGFKVEALRYSWSFLAPAAPIRKLRTKRYQRDMTFESAPPLINALLIRMSRVERAVSRLVGPPFGTSLTALVTKG
jgi:SAM-dependent methyltransferase